MTELLLGRSISIDDDNMGHELVGIVTVLFNSDEVLHSYFESLACQRNVRFRLYVIDNSPTDSGSRLCRDLAKQYGIDADITFNCANVGVAGGNNQGISQALRDGCTQVLLSNNDIEFKNAELIRGMLNCASRNNVDAVVTKIYYHTDPVILWFAGGRFSVYTATSPHLGDRKTDIGQYDVERKIDYAPTCFMLVRSQVFQDVGLMDERYFVYYDDTDFLWRMKLGGKRLQYWPHGKIWHKVSFSTGGSESVFSLYYLFRNRVLFTRKHFSRVQRALAIFYVYLTLLIKFLRFDEKQRDAVRRGLKDGFEINL